MSIRCLAIGMVSLVAWAVPAARGDDELQKRVSWKQPTRDEVKTQIDKWLAVVRLDDPVKTQVAALWPPDVPPSGEELLDRLVATASLVEPSAKSLTAVCHGDKPPIPLPTFSVLDEQSVPPLVRNSLRLYYGRWLAQHALYDEALTQIEALAPADVVDPASLLFYQGVVHHRLLNKDKCLPALSQLMENKGRIPRRFETLAVLMEADLSPVKPDSLDEVSRLMDDIERRLGFGRAGKKVRKQEDDVIAKLDKLIEELEKQQQQSSASSSGGKQSTQPMQDSQAAGGRGPGEVEQKKTGVRSGWGNLPPKQRQEALQQISKGLPAHYREVIEEYFRKLARDGNN